MQWIAQTFQLYWANLHEGHAIQGCAVDDLLADEHLARPRVIGDACGGVHGHPVIIAILKDDRSSMQSDVSRRKPSRGNPLNHLERCKNSCRRLPEVEH